MVIGMTRDAADETLTNSGFEYIIHGEGETVTDQVPSSGIRIPRAAESSSTWVKISRPSRSRCLM